VDQQGDRKSGVIGRLSAAAVESAVAERIRVFLNSPAEILDAVKQIDSLEAGYDRLLKRAKELATAWNRMTLSEKADLIRSILSRAIILEGSLELRLDLEATVQALSGKAVEEQATRNKVENIQTICLQTPFRNGNIKALKLVIGNDRSDPSGSREAIAKAFARARSWYDLIVQGKATGLSDLARQHRLTHRYVRNIFPLAFSSAQNLWKLS
jgi:hypothetical protein